MSTFLLLVMYCSYTLLIYSLICIASNFHTAAIFTGMNFSICIITPNQFIKKTMLREMLFPVKETVRIFNFFSWRNNFGHTHSTVSFTYPKLSKGYNGKRIANVKANIKEKNTDYAIWKWGKNVFHVFANNPTEFLY